MVLDGQAGNSIHDNRRKSSKPLMEKRRRARINQSLNELKSLILEAMKKDTSCYSKLEKADILEMTVRYLRSMRNQNVTACMNANDPNSVARYRAGYNECASEMTRYLMSLDGLDPHVRARLLAHLASLFTPRGPLMKPTMTTTESLQQLQQPQAITIPGMSQPMGPTNFTTNLFTAKQTEISHGGLLNATQLQIIPAQLANGKIAAVLVPSQNSPLAMVSSPQLIPVYDKAFPSQVSRTDNDPLWRPW